MPLSLSGKTARKKEIFDREFTAFWANVGDVVEFKHSNKNRIEWTVESIETDFNKCKWNKGGKQPMFIQLSRHVVLAGNKRRKEVVWTTTSQLRSPKKGGWNV